MTFTYLDNKTEGCPLESNMYNCNGTCIPMDRPCGDECYGGQEKCGNQCIDKDHGRMRECVEDGVVKCIPNTNPCNGECPDPDNYFYCGSKCKLKSEESLWRECNGDCIDNSRQCEGECSDSYFKCGDTCKPESLIDTWRTCDGDCDQGYCCHLILYTTLRTVAI